MNKQILTTVIAIGFTALIANTQVFAQGKHTVTLPFTFEAGGTEFPSGTYEISRMGHFGVIQITNVATNKSKAIPAPVHMGSLNMPSPKLVFRIAGDQYSLKEIWLEGSEGMAMYPTSKGGKEEASVKIAMK